MVSLALVAKTLSVGWIGDEFNIIWCFAWGSRVLKSPTKLSSGNVMEIYMGAGSIVEVNEDKVWMY